MSLNLKDTIMIDGTLHDFEISGLVNSEITEFKLDGRLFTATVDEPKEEIKQVIPEKTDKPSNFVPLAEFVKGKKSPNNTILFLNWLNQKHIKEFDINDFLNDHLSISKEQAESIIIHQIEKKKLEQLSNTKFRVKA
jgi:hypothetical protein